MFRGFIKRIKKLREGFDFTLIGALSAQSAFFIFISFFPFVMLLMSLINYLPVTQQQILNIASAVVPKSIMGYFDSILGEISQKGATAISVSAITALWSASLGVTAISRGINSIYPSHKKVGYIKHRLTSVLYTALFIVIIALMLFLVAFGSALNDNIMQSISSYSTLTAILISLRYIITTVICVIFFSALYSFIPRKKRNFIKQLPGALFATLGWFVFSFIYSFYIERAVVRSLYGSLTTIVFLLLWLYFCIYILFIGAQINQLIENSKS